MRERRSELKLNKIKEMFYELKVRYDIIFVIDGNKKDDDDGDTTGGDECNSIRRVLHQYKEEYKQSLDSFEVFYYQILVLLSNFSFNKSAI